MMRSMRAWMAGVAATALVALGACGGGGGSAGTPKMGGGGVDPNTPKAASLSIVLDKRTLPNTGTDFVVATVTAKDAGNVVQAGIKTHYPKSPFELGHTVGVDKSKLLVAKTGARGANWAG